MRTGVWKLLRTDLVPARAWRGHAVGIALTERLELRRQMAAAAGKEESVSLQQVASRGRTFHQGHAYLNGRSFVGENVEKQQKAQVFEAQTWRQVRGPAECETRDLGIKWPHWHTLPFEGRVAVDMREICPQDATNMLQGQACIGRNGQQSTECEELKEGSAAGANPSCAAKKRSYHCPVLEGGQKIDPRKTEQIRTKSHNFKER